MPFAATWVDRETVILSDTISLICRSYQEMTQMKLLTKQTHRLKRTNMVAGGRAEWKD